MVIRDKQILLLIFMVLVKQVFALVRWKSQLGDRYLTLLLISQWLF
jgi:hypothetical protein